MRYPHVRCRPRKLLGSPAPTYRTYLAKYLSRLRCGARVSLRVDPIAISIYEAIAVAWNKCPDCGLFGVAIMLAEPCIEFVGDSLRDVLDPKGTLASKAVDLTKILDGSWRFGGYSVGPSAREEQRGGVDFVKRAVIGSGA